MQLLAVWKQSGKLLQLPLAILGPLLGDIALFNHQQHLDAAVALQQLVDGKAVHDVLHGAARVEEAGTVPERKLVGCVAVAAEHGGFGVQGVPDLQLWQRRDGLHNSLVLELDHFQGIAHQGIDQHALARACEAHD